jgi:hypothetical protein
MTKQDQWRALAKREPHQRANIGNTRSPARQESGKAFWRIW